jgi:HK97 family phage major capsid protein/HK97 family phage prohead protease
MAATETDQTTQEDLPRDNLVRAIFPGEIELRDLAGDVTDAMPTMEVGFARYGEWTEISSIFEGNFMEQVAPGAFTKTIKENTPNMRALFEHGRDPQIGNKVLGPIADIRDTENGPMAEVPLLDTSYNRDLLPGLRAGVYGSSFRFKVIREEFNRDAEQSDYNPDGLPERTILEAKVMELGPVTFPAYAGATAGVRSLTDDFMFGRFASGADANAERSDESTTSTEPPEAGAVTTTAEAEPTHPDEPSRDTPTDDDRQPAETTSTEKEANMAIIDEMRERQNEIRSRLEEISSEHQGQVLVGDERAQWDELTAEWNDLDARCKAEEERSRQLLAMSGNPNHREDGADGQATPYDQFRGAGTGTYITKREGSVKTPDDPFDFVGYHDRAKSPDHLMRQFDDGAKRALERFTYPHPRAEHAEVNTHIERVMREAETGDRRVAQWLIACGSPAYRAAFWKTLTKQPLTRDEQVAWAIGAERALAVGAVGTGGAAVPPQIDPTLIPTANASINPLRRISRVFTTTSYVWQGVTSGGITAQYRAEGAAMTDNAPTLTAPQIQPERADAFVPFSWELGQDWGTLEANIASEFQEAKDQLEAVQFSVGAGHASNAPQGILTATNVAGTIVDSVAGTAFSVADIYKVEAALNARHQPNASWVAHPGMFAKVRQFDTGGGASLWVQLQNPNPPELIGYPAYKATNVGTAGPALTATAVWGIFGDFQKFAIVDRLGMSVRVISELFSGNTQGQITFPTGQSGLVAYWRNSSGCLDSNAFRVGTIATSI